MYLCVRGIDFVMYLCARGIDFVMYLCARGIDFASFCEIDILFWNCSDSVIFCLFFNSY
jgi:hypothetical protein